MVILGNNSRNMRTHLYSDIGGLENLRILCNAVTVPGVMVSGNLGLGLSSQNFFILEWDSRSD